MRHWRSVLFAVLAALFSFGGSFSCNTNDDDDNEINGHVSVNP